MRANYFLYVLALTVALLAPAKASGAGWALATYGEAITLEGEGGYSASAWTHALWIPAESRWVPAPYAGAAVDRYAPDSGKVNRLSPLLGAELRLVPELKLFTEYRYVTENPRSAYSRSDFRAGLVGGLWRELPLAEKLSLFSDTYGELLYLPRFSQRPTLTAFSKFGPRYRILPALSGDLFTEVYGHDSDDRNLGRRAFELRYGGRAVLSFGKDSSWSMSLGAFRRFISFRDAPDSRWRALFTIGGSL